jgi:hypothetical protein
MKFDGANGNSKVQHKWHAKQAKERSDKQLPPNAANEGQERAEQKKRETKPGQLCLSMV